MRKLPLALFVASLLPATIAFAQPGGPAPTPTPAPSGSNGIELPAGSASAPVPIPPAPNVNDPMLVPVPAAPHSISSWEEALNYLRARLTDLQTALAQVRQAEGNTRLELANVLTTINGSAAATQNLLTVPLGSAASIGGFFGGGGGTAPVQNAATAAISLTQPLFNLAQWDQVPIARLGEKQAWMNVDAVKRTITLNVANVIVGVVTAERVAELNRVGFRNALERLDLTQRKKALGTATGLDVIRVQQDVENARATIVTGDESLRQARESLGLALGVTEQVGVGKDININGLEKSALRICQVGESIDCRSDIMAARENLEVAKRNVANVYLQFYPSVNLTSTMATTSNGQAVPQTTWSISAVLSVPIWDGGVKYGNIRINKALADQAEQSLISLRRNAIIQLEQAQRGVGVAEQSRKVSADQRALAAEVDRLTQVSYTVGQSTSLDLVVSAAALRQADINLALAEFTLVKARILAVLALATCPW